MGGQKYLIFLNSFEITDTQRHANEEEFQSEIEEEQSLQVCTNKVDEKKGENEEKKVEDVEEILNDKTADALGPKTKYKPQDLKEDLISSAEV